MIPLTPKHAVLLAAILKLDAILRTLASINESYSCVNTKQQKEIEDKLHAQQAITKMLIAQMKQFVPGDELLMGNLEQYLFESDVDNLLTASGIRVNDPNSKQ